MSKAQNNIVSLSSVKERITLDQIARIRAIGRLIEDQRSENPRPLSQEELIERFKLEAHMAKKKPEKTVMVMVQRENGPVLVPMMVSQAVQYESGKVATVVRLKKEI